MTNLSMMYTSFHWHPSLAWKVELLAHTVNLPSWFVDSSLVVQLDLDMLLDHFCLGVEQNNRISFSHVNLGGQEGIRNTSWVTNHTSVSWIRSLTNFGKRKNLNLWRTTLTVKLRLSSPGMMSANLAHFIGFLSPLLSYLFYSYALVGLGL